MKPQSMRAKGKRLELQIAQDLRDSGLDPDARRMPLSGAADGFKTDIKTSLPLAIEAKNQQTWKPLEYWEQAKACAGDFDIPLVVMSKNRLPTPLAMLSWNDLIGLMQWAAKAGWAGEPKFSKRKQVRKSI